MKMDHALFMCLNDLLRKQNTLGQILGYLTGDQVSLRGSNICIFVGVFLHYILIAVFDQTHDRVIGSIGTANHFSGVTVNDILFGQLILTLCHELLLDHIMDILDHEVLRSLIFNTGNNGINSILRYLLIAVYLHICLLDRQYDLVSVIIYNSAIPFCYFHCPKIPLLSFSLC